MNTCGTCKWFKPHRDATTKRIRPSEKGYCTWSFPWPKAWPEAYRHNGYLYNNEPSKPIAARIWGHIEHRCACWEAKDAPKVEVVKQETML